MIANDLQYTFPTLQCVMMWDVLYLQTTIVSINFCFNSENWASTIRNVLSVCNMHMYSHIPPEYNSDILTLYGDQNYWYPVWMQFIIVV